VTCSDALNIVEAIAADDLPVDDAAREHFETCPRCAAALASARRIEVALRGRPQPHAPARFTETVVSRIRNEQWRAEERIDRIFNVAIAAAILLVVGGLFAITNVDAVLGGAGSLWGMVASVAGQAVQAAAPAVLAYIGAAGLLMSALAMWWWADRRVSL
jgi:hypothetical protein